MPLHAGDRLGGYEILDALGAGGMGAVWKARDSKLGRMVAIKVLKNDDGDLPRLIQEARIAAKLNHPNIVTIHEIGEQQGISYVVMEMVDGQTLQHHLVAGGLPLAQAFEYAVAVARALEVAHRSGVIHRDIKPQNIMVTKSGDIKLLDFGLAKQRVAAIGSDEPTLTDLSPNERADTATGQILGTVHYMSPEQAQGRRVDARSDIFSFGSLLYEILTGRRPFTGSTNVAVMAAILRDEPSMQGVPPAAAPIVRRCLQKDPAARYETATELRTALMEAGPVPKSGGRPGILWIGLAAAAVIAAGLMLWTTQRPTGRSMPLAPQPLTLDSGFTGQASLSPDGKLLAYASDRAEAGNLDIWLRQMPNGSTVRFTNEQGLEYLPRFSADGSKIYYLTGEQAIVEKPVEKTLSGGRARTVLTDAGPFSVSAKGDVVYARSVMLARPEPMWILAAGQSAPAAFLPACRSGANPIWSPDGEQVFFYGTCGKQTGAFLAPRNGEDWKLIWELPGSSADTSSTTTPYWGRGGGSKSILLLLPGRGLARLGLNGDMKLLLPGNYRWTVAGAPGELLLTDYTKRMMIRSFDRGTGLAASSDAIPAAGHFSVSRDGRLLAFTRLTSGTTGELVLKNLKTGEQKVYAEHDQLGASFGSLWPIVSPDGKQVVYRVVGQTGGHFLLNTEGGAPRRVASMAQFQLGSDWSPDGSRVLGECPAAQGGICQLDPATGAVEPFFRHPSDALLYPSWSWDGTAIVFMRRPPGGMTSIWVAPVAGGVVAPKESWFAISPPETDNSRPRFSPDGMSVYYLLTRDGVKRLVVQRLDRLRRKAEGEPVSLPGPPIELTAITGTGGPYPLVAVTAGRIYCGSVEPTANLTKLRLE
jgi:Tol biopolymer transport system component/tRNA A-37 threonylcarbamoyl transferase component Bud32